MFLIISIVTSCLRMATTVFFPVRATKLMKKKGVPSTFAFEKHFEKLSFDGEAVFGDCEPQNHGYFGFIFEYLLFKVFKFFLSEQSPSICNVVVDIIDEVL
jgi:hypothetical protein